MSKYDEIYKKQVNKIIKKGVWDKDQDVRPKWADGSPAYTKAIVSQQLVFDGSEVPILTTKKVAWKTAVHEIIWFYINRTSDCKYLDDNNVKIWKEWTREDNTIGKSYGYQLGKQIIKKMVPVKNNPDEFLPEYTNQVERLINDIKTNPASRRHIISLWNIDDAWDMSLQPCMWHNQFLIKEGKISLIVGIRSNDIALGQPINIFQSYVLQRMVAQVTGYQTGELIFNVNDAHIYQRHISTIKQQIKLEPFEAPTLWINPEIKNFDDFTINDFNLINYNYHPSLKYEVAI